MESGTKTKAQNLRASASWISAATFWWTIPIFKLGYSRDLEMDDLPEPLKEHSSKLLGDHLEREWNKELKKKSPNFFKAVMRTFWKSFGIYTILQIFIELGVKAIQPLFLGRLLRYFTPGSNMTIQEASLYALAVVICSVVFVITLHPFINGVMHLGMRLRVASCALIYRKTLRLSNKALQNTSPGQIINLVSNDVSLFDRLPLFSNDIWFSPIALLVCLSLMWSELGPSALVGVATLLLSIPLQVLLGKRTRKLRLQTAIRTDERVKLMSEILTGVQVIKMYAWEKAFAKLVEFARRTELQSVRATSQIRGINLSMPMFMTRLSVCVSLVAYSLLGNQISAEKVFVLMSYYTIIRHTMVQAFPQSVTVIAECSVSFARIQKFLLLDEAKTIKQENSTIVFQPEIITNKPIKKMSQSAYEGVYHISDTEYVVTVTDESENVEDDHVTENNQSELGVRLTNATAMWSATEEATLAEVDVSVKPGQLVAVIGPVGAGKSSLLHVILGELPLVSGQLEVKGRVSYAAQEPWLFTGSVKQNIIFGQPWDAVRYRRVLRACALETDLKIWSYGDKTVVGERGVQLSGGQRARVSLARAVYRQADIYLLDDPLSAVDAHVARHLFDECICGLLRHKSVLLVTHQLHLLQNANKIIVLQKGRILASGTYKSLQTSTSIDLERLLSWKDESAMSRRTESESSDTLPHPAMLRQTSVTSTHSSLGRNSVTNEEPQQIAEMQSQGSVSGKVYTRYLNAGGGVCNVLTTFILFLLTQLALSGSDLWLTTWTNFEESKRAMVNHSLYHQEQTTSSNVHLLNISYYEGNEFNSTLVRVIVGPEYLTDKMRENTTSEWWDWMTTESCMSVHAAIVLLLILLSLCRSAMFFSTCMKASQTLHDSMFSAVSKAAMSFFNNNPSGRILNRFSKDVGSIDEVLPQTMMDAMQIGLVLVGIVVVVALVNPYMLIPTAIIAVLFYGLRFAFLKTSRCIKRLDGISRSPVYSHTSASIHGLATIRAFEAEKTLISEFDSHQDLNSSAWYLFISCNRAFGYLLDIVCAVFIAIVTFSFLPLGGVAGNVGLAVTQAMTLTGMFQWGMRQSAELENNMTSVERVLEFCDMESEINLESEHNPPESWPKNGEIIFENVSLNYEPSEIKVLKNLTLKIRGGEKIGIVGRTGAGKSSLIAALFKLANINGRIIIDNFDTSIIGLHTLRSKISIIPQEPVLFSGTMRKNLDPFDEYQDDKLWESLRAVQLHEVVTDMQNGLYSQVSSGGGNLSTGQRQLVCLARAILRNNRILVLDEATASVDLMTDSLIQETIRTQFSDCTVLTIAHRVNTIMDADRVLVLDAGKVLEFASPHELLANRESAFSQLNKQQLGNSSRISISVSSYY